MRKFKSAEQVQRFLSAHAAVYNLFNLGRHLVSAEKLSTLSLARFYDLGKGGGYIGMLNRRFFSI